MNTNKNVPNDVSEDLLAEWEELKEKMSEQAPDIDAQKALEFLDEIFIAARHEYFGMESVKGLNNFSKALKNGEYVIGVDYHPTQYRDIFHYNEKLSSFEIFHFRDLGSNVMPPLKLKRVLSISVTDSSLPRILSALPTFDDLVVSRKNNFLELSNVMPSKFEEVIENLNKGVKNNEEIK